MPASTTVLICGLGITGQSIVRYLASEANLLVTDTRLETSPEIARIAEQLSSKSDQLKVVKVSELATHWAEITEMYVSPGLPLSHEIVQKALEEDIPVRGDIDLFLDRVDKPVLAITGTNGKTTVVSLITELLASRGFISVGNIGTPVLDGLQRRASGFVLELSSFQLERLKSPIFKVATCLNVTADHLDHHASFDEYLNAKQRIYENCETVIYNAKDELTVPQNTVGRQSIAINDDPKWRVESGGVVIAGEFVPASELSLTGEHNLFNIVVSAACAHCMGVSIEEMLPVLRFFKGLPHRQQLIKVDSGVTLIDDSKSTNVASTVAAIQAFSCARRPLVLLLGGDSKGVDLSPLTNATLTTDLVVLYGQDAYRFKEIMDSTVVVHIAKTFEQAIRTSIECAGSEGTILFSPACASFDMFSNYVERGRSFCAIARRLLDPTTRDCH